MNLEDFSFEETLTTLTVEKLHFVYFFLIF